MVYKSRKLTLNLLFRFFVVVACWSEKKGNKGKQKQFFRNSRRVIMISTSVFGAH